MTAERSATYERIYRTAARIPEGRVSTYGRIARLAGGCTARMVGYALHRLSVDRDDVPWHRIVNASGRISLRSEGDGAWIQRRLLEMEGVEFSRRGGIDLGRFGWPGGGTEREPPGDFDG